jgi:hypothetical protein
MTTYVQCHSRADAVMYAAVLREEGYAALVQTASDPTVVEVTMKTRAEQQDIDDALFDVYTRRVAN